MNKNKLTYELIGIYANYNNTGKLKLRLTNLSSSICCYIEDIKLISKYISEKDNQYINQLIQNQN